MSGSRTRTGCYSCRIRRKKCDEARPQCLACSSRGIQCLGYHVKPGWMLAFASWQDVLESDMAKSIRKSAENNYNLRRARRPPVARREDQHGSATRPKDMVLMGAASKSLTMPSWATPATMDSIWWDSNMGSANGSSTFNFRNVVYFVEIICPLQFGFASLHYHPDYEDHRWIINNVIQDEPLYHVATALALCFESGRQDGNTSGFCDASAGVLKSKVLAMRGLQERVNGLAAERQRSIAPPINLVSRILATVLHLHSLEIFIPLGGNWEMHLNAASNLLGLLQRYHAPSMPGSSIIRPETDAVRQLLAAPADTEEKKSFKFFIAAYVWTDIMARASTERQPPRRDDFEYAHLLRDRLIDPSVIMGCDIIVLTAMADINALEVSGAEMRDMASSDWTDFLARAHAIESAVSAYVREAANSRAPAPPSDASADSTAVTMIHAYAARIYLDVVTAGNAVRQDSKIRENVGRCLEELEVLPSRLFIRICWPFAVAGCMADEDEHARFKDLVSRVVADRQVLGFTWKALIIMEECWRLRRELGGAWCWKTTMRRMGLRVLFI